MVTSATAVAPGPTTTTPKNTTDTTESDSGIGAGTNISSDFTTFLKMLTTQMNNQDPLNPMDSSDFAMQLATFSGVEQQVKSNDLLKSMADQIGAMNMSNLSSWVGMEARSVSPVYFDGAKPVTIQGDPPTGAEKTYVVAYDSFNKEVSRLEVPVSDKPFQWEGLNANGQPLRTGNYTFYLESFSNGRLLGNDQMATYSEVTEARLDHGQTMLILDGGNEVAASDVDALRKPTSTN